MKSSSDRHRTTPDEPLVCLPISAAQRGLWWEHQLDTDSPAYTLCSAVRLHGSVDAAALQQALDAVCAAHEALRTTFTVHGGEPIQVVHPAAHAHLSVIDLTARAATELEAAANAICTAEARRPFDVTRLPLWRTTLVRMTTDEHLLIVARHHLVCDGRSMTIWFDALEATYAAALEGRPIALPPPVAQYSDFTRWQQAWLEQDTAARQLDYWRRQLTDAVGGATLTTDHPPRQRATEGACCARPVPSRLLARLNALARAQGTTPYTVLLAVFMLVLQRFSGRADLVVRSPVDARTRIAFEGVIGFLINSVALRIRRTGNPSFVEWLQQVRDRVLAASANSDVPFPHVVAALRRADPAAPALEVPVEFAYQAWEGWRERVLGLPADIRVVETGAVRSMLALCLDQTGDTGWIRAEFRTDVYTTGTIERLLDSLVTAAQEATDDPTRSLSAIGVLAPAMRRQVLLDLNRTHRPGVPSSLPAWVARRTVRPEAPAVVVGAGDPVETVWTYAQFESAIAAEAERLKRLGVRSGTPVAVCLPRSFELIAALWGIVEAGGAFVPLDPEAPQARRAAMLGDCGARVLIAAAGATAWAGSVATVIEPGGGVVPRGHRTPADAVSPESAAYVMYTSGSTGPPKGVVITHRGLCNRLRWMLDGFSFTAADRVVFKTPCTFDASVWEWVAPRLVGGCVVLAGRDGHRDPASLVRTMRDGGVTILQVVPSLLQMLLDEPALAQCTALRQVFCAGEVLPAAAAHRWHDRTGVPLCNTYGPTEAAIDVTAWRTSSDERSESIPIGRPIDNTRIYVLDRDGNPAPVGAVGDLFVAGAGLARGYLGRASQTADRFVPCPFGAPGERMYRTGDRARWRADGALMFAGRADTQIKLRGVRIELEAIEAELSAQPNVDRAVVSVVDVHGTPTLVAGVMAEPAVVAALASAMASVLPAAMRPGRYVRLPSVPLTAHGKIDRALVERWARDAAMLSDSPIGEGLSDSMDVRLARLWEQVLGVAVDDRETSFFALGGHSLLAVRLIARMEEQLGMSVPLATFFDAPTIAGLRRNLRPAAVSIEGDPPLALSSAQRRLWFLDQWGPRTATYTVAEAYRFEGSFDVSAWNAAVAAVVARHEVLRTRIVREGGDPQPILDIEPRLVEADLVDLLDVPRAGRDAAAAAARSAAAERAIDPGQTPLLHTTVVRLTPTTTDVVLAMPHVASDAESSAVLRADLAACYAAARRGTAAAIPALTAQYRHFAAWETAQIAAGHFDDGVKYWEERLAGAPQLALPTVRPRTAVRDVAGAVTAVSVPDALAAAVARTCRHEGVTPFMLLLAIFQAMLQRYTGQDDVAVGTVISQRHRPEWDPLVGLFLNTIVLRCDLGGDPTFRGLLERVRHAALGAYAHNVPFDRVIEALRPPRDGWHAPLCQAMFVHQHAGAAIWELDDLRGTPLGLANGAAKFDLTVTASEHAGGLSITAEYARALFHETTIARMLEHYVTLLRSAIDSPDARLSQLRMLSEAECVEIVASGTAAESAPHPDPHDVLRGIADCARARAASVGVTQGDSQMTFGELDAASNRLARLLRGSGVGPETCVALCLEPSIDLVVTMLGTLKAGGAYLPLDPAAPPARIAQAVSAATAPLVITSAERQLTGLPGFARVMGLRRLFDEADGHSGEPLTLDLSDARLAYVVLTSGSTGEPKLAGVEMRGLARLLRWYAGFGLSATDRFMVISSPSFDLTQKNILAPLLIGAGLYWPSWHPTDFRAAARAIAKDGITSLNCTPTAFYALLDSTASERFAALASLRYVFLGGEPIALDRLRPWLDAAGAATTLVNTYGPTECTDVVASHVWTGEAHDGEPGMPIGMAIPGTSLLVADRRLQLVPPGVEAELCVRGTAVGRGYLNRPRLTADRFRPDPFSSTPGARLYLTGDRARQRHDAAFECLGRVDRQIKLRGFRIEPGEIETLLERHANVARAVVAADQAGTGSARLVAFVVPSNGAAPSSRDLRAHLRASLPEFMVPSAFVTLAELPLTKSGKVDYSRLAAPAGDDAEADAAAIPASSATEIRLAAIWARLLGVTAPGIDDDFFASGGHSLLAVRLASEASEAFDVDLPLPSVFERPTIARLAEYIDALQTSSTALPRADGAALEENRV